MITTLFADRLAEYGIPVFEVRPGIIRTDMTAAVTAKYDKLITQIAYAESMMYSGKNAGSRGGAFVLHNNKVLPENATYQSKKSLPP